MAKKPARKRQAKLTLDMDFVEALDRFVQTDSGELPTATDDGKVVLYEDDTGDRLLIYSTDRGDRVELRYQGDQPWFTQKQLADMFGVSVRTVGNHVNKFIADGELGDSVARKFRATATDGKLYDTTHYALDVAFYVGYRVNSAAGVLFRRWATGILVQFATKGFVVDKQALSAPGARDRIRELLGIIQELRASEANSMPSSETYVRCAPTMNL